MRGKQFVVRQSHRWFQEEQEILKLHPRDTENIENIVEFHIISLIQITEVRLKITLVALSLKFGLFHIKNNKIN